MPFSPLGQGFLTGKIDENTRFDSTDFRNSPRHVAKLGEALARSKSLAGKVFVHLAIAKLFARKSRLCKKRLHFLHNGLAVVTTYFPERCDNTETVVQKTFKGIPWTPEANAKLIWLLTTSRKKGGEHSSGSKAKWMLNLRRQKISFPRFNVWRARDIAGCDRAGIIRRLSPRTEEFSGGPPKRYRRPGSARWWIDVSGLGIPTVDSLQFDR